MRKNRADARNRAIASRGKFYSRLIAEGKAELKACGGRTRETGESGTRAPSICGASRTDCVPRGIFRAPKLEISNTQHEDLVSDWNSKKYITGLIAAMCRQTTCDRCGNSKGNQHDENKQEQDLLLSVLVIDSKEFESNDELNRWPTSTEFVEEMKAIGKISGPMVLTGLLLYSRAIISMLFLGYLGEVELAGGSLSIGLTLQRTVPIGFLWLNMERILLWCGQNESITRMAGIYILFSIPDLLTQAFLQPLRIYLRTQNITLPLTWCAAIALLLHIPINVLPLEILFMKSPYIIRWVGLGSRNFP
eukprot:Gb_40048 [translate_table: standard]